jgi:hypothetical protein
MRFESTPLAFLALAAGLGWLACSPTALERLREHTYPPSFNYIPEDQLKSTMWELAAHAAELDRLMRQSKLAGPALQEQVIFQLTELERVAEALGPGDWPSNHPQVSRNIEHFRRDIELARSTAALEPPNYFLAGSVAGTCVHCHDAD